MAFALSLAGGVIGCAVGYVDGFTGIAFFVAGMAWAVVIDAVVNRG